MRQRAHRTTEPIKSESDINALKGYFWNKNLRDYALFVFMLNTGRRISDTLSLDVGDVACMKGGKFCMKDRVQLYEQKTGKYADFPLNDVARRAVSKYLHGRKRRLPKDESMAEFLREPLFKSQKPRRNGEKRLRTYSACRIMKQAARACGIDIYIGTHSLRKTFGYSAHSAGKDIADIQAVFNHSSQAVTLRYIGITQEDIDDVYFAVGEGNQTFRENRRLRRKRKKRKAGYTLQR